MALAGSAVKRGMLALLLILASAGLVALGIWQLQRLEWKLDLIERVTQRVNAAPVAAPGPEQWPTLTAATAEYRHVTVSGRFLHQYETTVHAATTLGTGYWVMTPLRTDNGYTVFINRGYVDMSHRDPATRAASSVTGTVTLTGLLRINEPGGGVLRRNDPAGNRWYSRDVVAMAKRHGLAQIAPYFIDAKAVGERVEGAPVAGLTVVRFNNNHLSYALTWFALSLLPLLFLVKMFRVARQPTDR